MSSFGTIFRVTTFGESHCKGVGAIVDGVPPRLALTEADIQPQLTRRRPGQSRLTTPRAEKDLVSILSGTEYGYTLGTPIGLFVKNEDQRPGDYKEMSKIPRPGHADFSYLVKYGTKASSGGGRSSARETIGRVAAGAIAEKWLNETYGTTISCWVSAIGEHSIPEGEIPVASDGRVGWTREEVDKLGTLRLLRDPKHWRELTEADEANKDERKKRQMALEIEAENAFLQAAAAEGGAALCDIPSYEDHSGKLYNHRGELIKDTPKQLDSWRTDELLPLRCPHPVTACKMATLIRQVKKEKDSIGGSVACVCVGVPPALGEPVFDRLEAKLAHAMLSLPATKGFEIGSGFSGTCMRGSAHNDPFIPRDDASTSMAKGNTTNLTTRTNHAGGTLGGITTGAPIYFKVAVKPVSTIGQAQSTTTIEGEQVTLEAKGRHDPCVLPRTPPLVEGMAALVLADAALIQRTRLPGASTAVCDGSANFEPWAQNGAAEGSEAKRPRH